jgi:hypothetical protein
VFSQNYLTVGQVYNFNVGDVFEAESGQTEFAIPPTYNLTIVLAKWYSAHSDTVFYKDRLVYYTPPACPPPCAGTFNTRVDTIFYTHLSSMAAQDTGNSPCPITLDTIYYDTAYPYCNRKVWEESPSQICIDSTQESVNTYSTQSWLVQGCGGPYYILYGFDFNNDIPYRDYYSLIYYKKNDTVCGSEVVITGINQPKQVVSSVDVYPNPSKGLFTIAFSHPELVSRPQTISVYNIMGQKVTVGMLNPPIWGQHDYELDLTAQPNGVYFYRVISGTGSLIGDGKLIIAR